LDVCSRGIDYPHLEIIVVDNCSTDGSAEMVQKEFPDVRLIRNETNIGTPARNLFFDHAQGKYIFSYDDDSFPAQPSTILNVVEWLERNPEYASVSFLCYQPLSGFYETGELRNFFTKKIDQYTFEGVYFVEGGMCFRNEAIRGIRYDERLFWGAEGADLSLQMYQRDLCSVYTETAATLHMKSPLNRSLNIYQFTKNYILVISKHFPFFIAFVMIILFILRKCIGMLLHPSRMKETVTGISSGLLNAGEFLSYRPKLNLRQILGLKRWYFMLYRW
jgi:GT2 family glycosyltransferase